MKTRKKQLGGVHALTALFSTESQVSCGLCIHKAGISRPLHPGPQEPRLPDTPSKALDLLARVLKILSSSIWLEENLRMSLLLAFYLMFTSTSPQQTFMGHRWYTRSRAGCTTAGGERSLRRSCLPSSEGAAHAQGLNMIREMLRQRPVHRTQGSAEPNLRGSAEASRRNEGARQGCQMNKAGKIIPSGVTGQEGIKISVHKD